MVDIGAEVQPVRPKTFHEPILIDSIKPSVPDFFKKITQGEPFRINNLTSIPEKDDFARNELVRRLTDVICGKDPDGWACIYGDIDQLKVVNERFGRSVGDRYITWGTASLLDGIANIPFSPDVTALPVRDSHAADETEVWLFGLTPDETKKLKETVEDFSSQRVMLPDGFTVEFSSSYGFVTSENPRLATFIADTKDHLAKNKDAKAYDLFTKVEEQASDLAREEKLAKELTRLPVELLFESNHIDEFIMLITSDFGGGRVSSHMLELLLKLQSIKAVSSIAPNEYQAMLERVGLEKKSIEDRIRSVGSAEEKIDMMVKMFQDLFGRLDD